MHGVAVRVKIAQPVRFCPSNGKAIVVHFKDLESLAYAPKGSRFGSPTSVSNACDKDGLTRVIRYERHFCLEGTVFAETWRRNRIGEDGEERQRQQGRTRWLKLNSPRVPTLPVLTTG